MKKADAVKPFGTQEALAQALGMSSSSVYKWGENVPPSRIKSIEMAISQRARELEQQAADLRRQAGQ